MSGEEKDERKELDTSETSDFPEEKLRVAPLSFRSRRHTTSELGPLVIRQRDPAFEVAPLTLSSRRRQLILGLTLKEAESLQVEPLRLPSRSRQPISSPPPSGDDGLQAAPPTPRRRAAILHPNPLRSGQDEFEIRPLTIRKAAEFPTTPRSTTAALTSNPPSTPPETESVLEPALSENTAFDPQVLPLVARVSKEETSPGVINRRLRTGHLITATPPDESTSNPENEGASIGNNPELLQVPHTTGKASDFWYRNVAGFPIIGEAPEVVERRWEDIMADDDTLGVSPLKITKVESSEEAVSTPPNTAISPPEDSESLIPTDVAVESGAVNPIVEDLTPSYGTSGNPPGDSDQPASEDIADYADNTLPIVTVTPARLEARHAGQEPLIPKAQAGQDPVTPENPPPPPGIPPFTFISPDADAGQGRPSPDPFPTLSPLDPSLVTPPNRAHRPPGMDTSGSTGSEDRSSPATIRTSPGRGNFRGDRGKGYAPKRRAEREAQAARDEAVGLNSPRSLPTSRVHSPGSNRSSPTSPTSQQSVSHTQSSSPLAAQQGQEQGYLPGSEVTGSAEDESFEWRRMPVLRTQKYSENDLFVTPVEEEDEGSQQTRPITEGIATTLGSLGQPPDMETEEHRAERGRIARERIHARQVTTLREDPANTKRLGLLRDEAFETGLQIEIPPQARYWEEFAQRPENRNADCVRVANEMYNAMQIIHAHAVGFAHKDNAARIDAEIQNAEFKKMLADRGGDHYVLKAEAQEVYKKMELGLSRCEKEKDKIKKKEEYWENETRLFQELAQERSGQLKKKTKDHKKKNSDLMDAIKGLQSEIDGQKRQTQNHKKDLEKERKDHEKLKRRHQLLEAGQKEEFAKEARGQKSQLVEMERQRDDSRKLVKTREDALEECHKEKKALREAASEAVSDEQVKQTIKAKDKKIAELEDKLTDAERENERLVGTVNSVDQKNRDQIKDLEKANALRISFEEQHDTIRLLKDDLKNYTDEVIELRDEKRRIADDGRETLESARKEWKNEMDELQGDIDTQSLSLQDLNKQFQYREHQVITSQEKIEEMQETNEKLEKKVEKGNHETKRLITTRDRYQARSEKCEAAKARLDAEILRLSTHIAGLEAERKVQEQNIQEPMETNDAKSPPVTNAEPELGNKVQKLSADLETVKAESEINYQSELRMRSEVNRLTGENNQKTTSITKLVQFAKRCGEERTALERKIDELKDDNAANIQTIHTLEKEHNDMVDRFNDDVEKITEERDRLLGRQDRDIKDRDENIQELWKAIDERDKAIEARNKVIEAKNKMNRKQKEDIFENEKTIGSQQGQKEKLEQKQEDLGEEITKLGKELQDAKENLKRCHDDHLVKKDKLRICEENRKEKKAEIDALKDEVKRSAASGSHKRISGLKKEAQQEQGDGEDKGPSYTPRTPSRRLAKELSDALSDHEDDKKPTSLLTPPQSGSKPLKTPEPKRPRTPPAQIITRAKSPDGGDTDVTGMTEASMASSSPIDYVGPPPAPENIDLAILRIELALRQMRNERAQHGFHHSDSLVVRNAARDVWAASELLPEGTDEKSKIRDYYLARGAFYLGVSYYYRDEAHRAYGWFRDVGNFDSELYPPELIEKWMERCEVTQGPPKDASYYKDPPYEGKGKEEEKKLPKDKKPPRRGSDKPPKPDPKKDNDSDDGDDGDGDDGHGGGGAGFGDYLTPSFMSTASQERRRAASPNEDDNNRPKTEGAREADQPAEESKSVFSRFLPGLGTRSSSIEAKKKAQFQATVAEVPKAHLVQKLQDSKVSSQPCGPTQSSIRVGIEGLTQSPLSSTSARKTDIKSSAQGLVQSTGSKIETGPQSEQPSIRKRAVQDTESGLSSMVPAFLRRGASTKHVPPKEQVSFKATILDAPPGKAGSSSLQHDAAQVQDTKVRGGQELESMTPGEIAAYDFESVAKIMAEDEAKAQTENAPSQFTTSKSKSQGTPTSQIPAPYASAESLKAEIGPQSEEPSIRDQAVQDIKAGLSSIVPSFFKRSSPTTIQAEAGAGAQTENTQSQSIIALTSTSNTQKRLTSQRPASRAPAESPQIKTEDVTEPKIDSTQENQISEKRNSEAVVEELEKLSNSAVAKQAPTKKLQKSIQGQWTAAEAPSPSSLKIPPPSSSKQASPVDFKKPARMPPATPVAPRPEVTRITGNYLKKLDKAFEDQGAAPSSEETPTAGETSPRKIPIARSPKVILAEIAARPVNSKETAQPLTTEGEASPRKVPLPNTPKNATAKPEAKTKKSTYVGGSMRATKETEKEAEKPLSKLEAAEVAERVGKEKWFKDTRNAKEKREGSEGPLGHVF